MKQRNILEIVKRTIKDNEMIAERDIVVLGLSGGPDSLCLFYILLHLAKDMNFQVRTVHLNHGFRGEEADRDQRFIEKLCQEENIKCYSYKKDCVEIAARESLSNEEAGRNTRYEVYSQAIEEIIKEGNPRGIIKLAVGHNLDDQVETVVHRMIRGSGIDGLGAMDHVRKDKDNNTIIRPILDVEREDIERFCQINHLNPRVDKTNNDEGITRNKIRKTLIPYIKENFNPNFGKAIVRLTEIAKEDREFLWEKTEEAFENAMEFRNDEKIVFQRGRLANVRKPLRSRVIMMALRELGLTKGISQVHLIQGNELVEKGEISNICNFPKGYTMEVGYGKIDICKKKELKQAKDTEAEKGKVPLQEKPRIVISIGEIGEYVNEPNQAVLDYDAFIEENSTIKDPEYNITVRTRESGDFIPMANEVGNKKIQNLFVDMKLPSNQRDDIFLVALGREVLWIPEGRIPARYTGKYRLNQTTKRILVLKVQR